VELARLRRRFGFIFQNFSLISKLPVWENITYPLIPCGIRRGERTERARALLSRLGLAEKFWACARELSGGEQQRVAIARALVGQPEVLFADEPTSNLDPGAAQGLRSVLQEAHRDGKTLILSTHDPGLIALATNVYQLEAGRLIL
jgi:ABC-type ATPase involved in cell division